MKTYVLDSFAILAYSGDERGSQKVIELFERAYSGEISLSICVVNWGECCYIMLREQGEDSLNRLAAQLKDYPIEVVDADQSLTLRAARYKAFHKMSFADAYAAALASARGAELVTGDEEFRPLEKEIKILWI